MQLGNINPVNLRGLKQALYVLECLVQGKEREQIAMHFDGDLQLVELWSSFLIHNHWIEKAEDDENNSRYLVTDNGRDWLHRVDGIDGIAA